MKTNAMNGSPFSRQQSELEQSEYSSEQASEQRHGSAFEHTNQLFTLRSALNEAELVIQRMSIHQQQQNAEDRSFYQQIQTDKVSIQTRQRQLVEELTKQQLIAEAETNAKLVYLDKVKHFQQIMAQLRDNLGLQANNQDQLLVSQLQRLNIHLKGLEQGLLSAREELKILRQTTDDQSRTLSADSYQKMRSIERASSLELHERNQVITDLQKQLDQRHRIVQQQTIKLIRLESVEHQRLDLERRLSQKLVQNVVLSDRLSSLKAKQQMFSVTKDKWQEDRLKYSQQSQQFYFQLQLANKKLSASQGKLLQQQSKMIKLEQLICQYKNKLKRSEQQRIQAQQSMSELEKQLRVGEIYQEKYRKAQRAIEEQQRVVGGLRGSLEEYQLQIHHWEEQWALLEGDKQQLEGLVGEKVKLIESLERQAIKLNMTISHQAELLKEAKRELARSRQELEDARKEFIRKKSIISVPSQSLGESMGSQRQQWQRMSEQVISHYQSLLQNEDSNRIRLQQQLQSFNDIALQLRNQLAAANRELSQLGQDHKLVRKENQRLCKTIQNLQNKQQKSIQDLKHKFRGLYSHELPSPIVQRLPRTLEIVHCFNFSHDLREETSQQQWRVSDRKVSNCQAQRCYYPSQRMWQGVRKQESKTQVDAVVVDASVFWLKPSQLDKEIVEMKERNRTMRQQLRL